MRFRIVVVALPKVDACISHNVVLSSAESKLLSLRVNSKIPFVGILGNNCPPKENKLENDPYFCK